MKKIAPTLLCLAMLFSLAACGAGPNSSSVPAGSATSNPAASSAEGSESEITGVIKDATMNAVTIETGDGKTLEFATGDADKTGVDGLLVGDRISVYYTGEIDGEDTSGAQVTRLVRESAAGQD